MSATTTTEITIQVNGKPLTFSTTLSLFELLESQNLNPRLIAIEYNGEILHRQFWPDQRVQDGDQLEIVTIVGGG